MLVTQSRHFRWPLGLAAVVLGVSAADLAYRFTDDPGQYTQFIIGGVTWRAAAKTPDYVLLATLVVTASAGWLVLRSTTERLARRLGASTADVFVLMLGFCTLPMTAWLGANLVGPSLPLDLVHLAAFAVVVATTAALALQRSTHAADAITCWLPVTLVMGLLGGLFLPALALAVNRLAMIGAANPVWLGRPDLVWLSAPGAVGGSVAGVVLARRSLLAHARHVIAVLQLPLPWAFLVILPLPWIEGGHVVRTVPLGLLPLAALALVAVGYLDLIRRWFAKAAADESREWLRAISPVCLAALLLIFRVGVPPTASVVSDDYHFGEWVLPWWSWAAEGLLPFRDYVPARGLVNYTDGACAALLGDSSASFIRTCQPLVMGSWFVLAMTATAALVGALPAAGMFALMPLADRVTDIDLAMTALLMLAWWMFDKAPGVRWLLGWAVCGIAAFLFAPGQGALLLAATMPLAVWQIGRALMDEPRRLRTALLWFLAATATVLLLTPMGAMLVGAWRYVAEHAAVASAAHGIEWSLSAGSQGQANYWMWEVVRTAFIAVPIVSAAVLGDAAISRDWNRARRIAIVAVPVVMLGMLYIPRAASRIDPAVPSRLGLASVWMFAALLPMVLHAAWSARAWASILAISTFVLAAISAQQGFVNLRVFEMRAIPTATVPLTLVEGKRFGVPGLGLADVEFGHLTRLTTIRRALDALLDEGESYLDLTNRNAHYFYFDRRPPIESGAIYNLPNEAQQLRAIRRLERNPVPVVLASADSQRHGDGPPSLRDHAFYRYAVQRLSPVSIDRYIFLVRNDRLDRLAKLTHSTVVTADPASLLDQAFAPPFLQSIPVSWGRSWGTLQANATHVTTLQTGGSGAWDFTQASLDGRTAGLLVLAVNCASDNLRDVQMSVSWTGDAGRGTLTFASDSTIVVPLDASPRWLLARRITGLQVGTSDASRCGPSSVTSAELWQRRIASVTDIE